MARTQRVAGAGRFRKCDKWLSTRSHFSIAYRDTHTSVAARACMHSPFVPQRLRRLNAKCATRRDDARQCTAQDRRQREDHRSGDIRGPQLSDLALREYEDCHDRADTNAQRDLNEGALEYGREDIQRLRAERNAHADLPRALGDGEGRHRIDAGERQHERHNGQADQELDPERVGGLGEPGQRLRSDHAECRIDRLRELAETRREPLWIAADVNGDAKRSRLTRQPRLIDTGPAPITVAVG